MRQILPDIHEEFDYSKLRGKIKEVFGTQDKFARKLEISTTALSARLNNKAEFSQKEMKRTCELLGISYAQCFEYFFTLRVRENELCAL